MPTISLCMIVKNEQDNIRRCLDSAQGFVDEIIIVDTGSTDRTKQICLEAGAKVYDFIWTEDFSQARNFGLGKAACDWILWIDSDEELLMYDFPALKGLLESTADNLIAVKMIHLYGQAPEDEHRSYRCTAFRLLRNFHGISFTGAIHERLDTGALEHPIRIDPNPYMSITHYGYMDINYKRKADRNLTALLKQKKEQPDDAWLDYHLAVELHRANDRVKSLETVNRSIAGFLNIKQCPPSLAYKLKYEILVACGNFNAAYPGVEKAIALYPDYVDLYYYRGNILYGIGRYEEAVLTFLYCLILGEANPEYLIMTGVGSFHALYHLGLCYEKQNKFYQAMEAYRQAIILYPDYEQAKSRLQTLECDAFE